MKTPAYLNVSNGYWRASMNGNLKKSLQAAFAAPPPLKRGAFLAAADFPRITFAGFVLAQAGYIRKRVWAASFAVTALAFIAMQSGFTTGTLSTLTVISSLLPFAALAGITELIRSQAHNMAELEMSCRYNLTQVVLTRLAIIGGLGFVTMVTAALMVYTRYALPAVVLCGCLFAPFLLTCVLSLFAVNRLRDREGVYVCGAAAFLISFLNIIKTPSVNSILENISSPVWLGVLTALTLWLAVEVIKYIKRTEAIEWNWSSTV
jgi:hypothetical protein